MVEKKLGETDIVNVVLYLLLEAGGYISTAQLKKHFKEFVEPVGENIKPLLNRTDTVIDQIIRNVVSHKNDSKNNLVAKGYVEYNILYGLKITDAGKAALNLKMKEIFIRELNGTTSSAT